LKNQWARLALLSGKPTPPPPQPEPSKVKEHPRSTTQSATANTEENKGQHAMSAETPPPDLAPAIPENPVPMPAQPGVTPAPPVALPANLSGDTNADMANPAMPIAPIPASAAVPDSAFVARDIAEKSLDADIVAPTGHGELLKIIGKRDESQPIPVTWTFYFFDRKAAGHARIVTVNGGKTIKNGEDLVDFASPYSDSAILPEDKIQKDSSDALQIAEDLIPGVTVSSSEFTLSQQKNSVPMWKVALWTKDSSGEEHKLGDVTLLSENGTVISKNLKP
jgi:hypothetical protein